MLQAFGSADDAIFEPQYAAGKKQDPTPAPQTAKPQPEHKKTDKTKTKKKERNKKTTTKKAKAAKKSMSGTLSSPSTFISEEGSGASG